MNSKSSLFQASIAPAYSVLWSFVFQAFTFVEKEREAQLRCRCITRCPGPRTSGKPCLHCPPELAGQSPSDFITKYTTEQLKCWWLQCLCELWL